MEIRSLYTFKTAENTPLVLELAGVGNRVFAFLLDMIVVILIHFVIVMAVAGVGQLSGHGLFTLPGVLERMNLKDLAKTLYILLTFLNIFGYFFFFEWLWNGRTPGKYALGIRTVRNNGQAIGFWESFGRNVPMRLVDVFMTGIGIFPLLISRTEKRFGDFLVGTLVIRDQKYFRPSFSGIVGLGGVGRMSGSAAKQDSEHQALMEPMAIAARQMTADEYELLRQFLVRRPGLFTESARELTEDLTAYFKDRFHLPEDETSPPELLEKLSQAYRNI